MSLKKTFLFLSFSLPHDSTCPFLGLCISQIMAASFPHWPSQLHKATTMERPHGPCLSSGVTVYHCVSHNCSWCAIWVICHFSQQLTEFPACNARRLEIFTRTIRSLLFGNCALFTKKRASASVEIATVAELTVTADQCLESRKDNINE